MATVADLERLRALTDRLSPIAQRGQGELIRAQEWNTLIGAVVEIARVVLAEDHQASPAPHEHPDQVTDGWLEPKLRALIERGPLSDPAAITRLQSLEQRVERLSSRVEELAGHIGNVRDRVTEVTSRDLIRQADVTNVRRVVEGLDDSRESVRELRESLRSIQKDVTTAVSIGQQFIIDGEPLDVRSLLGRINGLEEFRERLRAPNGELFDAKGFENRLTEFTNTLVTQQQLDTALGAVRRRVSPEELAALENNLRTDLTEQVNSSLGSLGNEIRAETNARFSQVDELVSRAVSDALPNLTTSILNTVRPEVSATVENGVRQSQARFDRQLSELSAGLSADYNQKISELRLGVEVAVRTEFANQLPAVTVPIQTRVDTLARLVEPMAVRLDAAEATITKAATRVEEVRRELLERDAAVRSELLVEIDKRDADRGRALDARFAQFDQATDRKLADALTDIRRDIVEDVRRVASDTAKTEVNLATTRLRGEFVTISRDSVSDLVKTEITALQPTLTRNVALELNRLR
ncbi:MAG: hypothetical protein AB7P69_04160 [Candidatus Binatia bacterium]